MTRRLLIASLFVGFALSSTGCCGVLRNCVYRFRMNHGCCPPVGCAPYGDAGPGFSPSYSIGAPAMAPAPGCAGCGASAIPGPQYGTAMPSAPGYAYNVPTVPPVGSPSLFPGVGAKMAGAK